MATWEEVRELANKLKKTQNQPNICKLSERTWVDIIRHLSSVNRLKLVFSSDGRSYLTKGELDKEIRDEVEAHSGRITLMELASNLDVDFDVIETRVLELITLDAQSKSPCRLISIPSEVINSSYVRRVAHLILDRLEEQGQTSIGELTTMFSLPTTFISNIMQEYQSTLFRVHKYGEKYFMDTFLNATKAKIRGYFTGVVRPVTLSSVASKLQVPESLMNGIISSLISTGRLQGNLIAGRSIFVPQCYTHAEDTYVNSFYSQNGYIEWNYLKRLNIADPGSYLKTKLPNAIHLPGLTINTLLVDQLKSLISGVIRDVSWIDLTHYIPSGLDSNETSALINPLLKDSPVKLIDTYLIADKFIENCENFLDTYLKKKAQTAFYREHRAILSIPPQQQSVEVNAPKQGVMSSKGGFGFGAREIKTKNVKKKYNPSRRKAGNLSTNSDTEANFHSGFGDSHSLMKDLFARYVLMDEVRSILSSQLPSDVPAEVIDQVVDLLESSLQQSFARHISSLVSPNTDTLFDREQKIQTQEIVNSMLLSLQLLERGISSVNRESLKSQLLLHLLKNHGMPVIRQLCDYISYEFGIPWPESVTSNNDLLKMNSSDPTQNNSVKSNITESLCIGSYHSLMELLKNTGLPDALSVSGAIQQVMDSFKVGQNNLTSLDVFFTSIKNLSVDKLGLAVSVFHSSNSSNKREREERLKANELAVQVEIKLKESVYSAKNDGDFLKAATTATLSATCLFAQIVCGWPVASPGKCVPELIDWLIETLKLKDESEDGNNAKSNSHVTALKILQVSNVLNDLNSVANYISEKVRFENVSEEESSIQAYLEHILEVGIQCRKQLYA
ncbi:hypothetical protein MN116_001782 [Schistosoma mekongi]|uniref:E3 UFM1-protein ligase 1 homolog n=1 Tax=Schistosoma mekongi TaxID=38744 RepID=A0AAE1ZIP2_SCHME|nr:hypothetical protein MN116_001782 [Schistosoma mekongi]